MDLFILAEKQLQKEIKKGERIYYTILDVIDYAYKIRKHLDKQDEKKQKTQFKKER